MNSHVNAGGWLLIFGLAFAHACYAQEKGEVIFSAGHSLSARANWEQNDYQDYRYTLKRGCYCPLPANVRVTVRNGRVVEVLDLERGTSVSEAEAADSYPTISELLSLIDEAVASRPDNLTITYDRHLGYPRRIYVDFSYRIADDALDYTLSDLELLKRP